MVRGGEHQPGGPSVTGDYEHILFAVDAHRRWALIRAGAIEVRTSKGRGQDGGGHR